MRTFNKYTNTLSRQITVATVVAFFSFWLIFSLLSQYKKEKVTKKPLTFNKSLAINYKLEKVDINKI